MNEPNTPLPPGAPDFIPGPGPAYHPSYSINGLALATGWSRSRIYGLINEGLLETYTLGSRTFVVGESVRDCIEQAR